MVRDFTKNQRGACTVVAAPAGVYHVVVARVGEADSAGKVFTREIMATMAEQFKGPIPLLPAGWNIVAGTTRRLFLRGDRLFAEVEIGLE